MCNGLTSSPAKLSIRPGKLFAQDEKLLPFVRAMSRIRACSRYLTRVCLWMCGCVGVCNPCLGHGDIVCDNACA